MAEQGEGAGAGSPQGEPSEEELRAQLEEEIRKVKVEDVLVQSFASVLNLSARRIEKEDERDLTQAKLGIDAARAVVDLLPDQAQPQFRQAISQLQLLYARQAGEGEPAKPEGTAAGDQEAGAKETGGEKRDSGLWTPPGT